MPEAVIVDAVRTPIGRAFKGSLAPLRPDDMGAFIVDQLLERNPDVDPALGGGGHRRLSACRRAGRRSTWAGSSRCCRRSCRPR